MKTTWLVATAAVAALSIAGCHKKTAATTEAGNMAESTGAAAANTASAVNPGQTGPVNQAQDATSGAVGAASATVGAHDTGAFVDNLAQGNAYEIQAAKIAEQKATAPDVKAFAHMMVIQHTALGNQAKTVIIKAGKTAPVTLDQRHKGLLDNLRAAGPSDFDKTYMDQQVAAHQETLNLINGYSQNGDDADLKAFAAQTAPKVQDHLDKAQALQSKIAAGGSAGSGAGQ
jgi:putative membrane protein